jgi:hypothetical protein
MNTEEAFVKIAELCKGTCSVVANDWTVCSPTLEHALAGPYAEHDLSPDEAHEIHTAVRWFEFYAYTDTNVGSYRVSGPSFSDVVARMLCVLLSVGYEL